MYNFTTQKAWVATVLGKGERLVPLLNVSKFWV
jgi:hypothetical protein